MSADNHYEDQRRDERERKKRGRNTAPTAPAANGHDTTPANMDGIAFGPNPGPEPEQEPQRRPLPDGNAAVVGGSVNPRLRTILTSVDPFDSLAVVKAFEAFYAPVLAWTEERTIWRTFDGSCWSVDDERTVQECGRQFSDGIECYVRALPWVADNDDATKAQKAAQKIRVQWKKVADSLRGQAKSGNLPDVKTGLQRAESQYDRDPYSLNTGDVVLDLSTDGTGGADFFFTKRTGVEFDPNAYSQEWEDFLGLILHDLELRAYIRRGFAAGLSGGAGERLIFAACGPPNSGKSTLARLVENTMGNYATTVPVSAFLLKKHASNSGHTSELIGLVGARMAFVHELPEGVPLNTGFLKGIVGGDTFSVSEKGHPYFRVRFRAKVYLVSNHLIVMDGTDAAAWDRFNLMPFETPIKNPDRRAQERLANDPKVQAACLRWLWEGWLDFQKNGLAKPAGIVAREGEQQRSNVLIQEWSAEHLTFGPGLELDFEEARRSYNEWAEAVRGGVRLGAKTFRSQLAALGLRYVRTEKSRSWVGASMASRAGPL